jgi:chemotaxis protein CheD
LLGSCVTVILTDPRRTVATMCHIVHTGKTSAAHRGNTAFGDEAMTAMFSLLVNAGVVPRLCDAYVYGGGNMFPNLIQGRTVGDNNVSWVLNCLEQEGIQVVDHCIGEAGYRKVFWEVGQSEPTVEMVPVEEGNAYAD